MRRRASSALLPILALTALVAAAHGNSPALAGGVRTAGLPAGLTVPPGLPSHLGIGLGAGPGDQWMPDSGIPFDYTYQYLAGGANTGSGWRYWNTDAQFPLWYAQGASANGYIPFFSYYMML